jgi:glutamate-1-semialdehyde 2,1-aminomutase
VTGATVDNVPFDVQVVPYNDLDAATQVLEGRDVAAVLVEPMLGASGCIPGTPEFLRGLAAAADAAGTLFVLDEVMTSRLGAAGLGQQLGLRPDLVTLGKYVGGGLSFGAFGGRVEVMDLFDPTRPDALAHAGTFNNNLASMLAGRAGLTKVFTPDVAEAHTQRGERLRGALNDAVCDHGLLVTGVGSLMAIHPLPNRLRHNGSSAVISAEDVAACDARLRELLFLGLLERGYYIAPRGYLALSLAVTDEQLDGFVDAAGEVAAGLADLAQ